MFKRLIAALLLALAAPCMACCAATLENPGAAVKVVDARIVTREEDKRLLVTVLGSLKNETGQSVGNLTVEVKLLDAQGQMVDVLTKTLYEIETLMPGDQVAFRIQNIGASPPAAYARVQARVTSGESQQPKAPAQPTSKADSETPFIITLIVSYGPMLLLIAVWVWFGRRMGGKKSPQMRLIAEQNALIQRQVAALEKLAKIAPPPA